MAYRVNYGLKRAERTRAKQAKKELKMKEREAQAAERARAKEERSESTPRDDQETTSS